MKKNILLFGVLFWCIQLFAQDLGVFEDELKRFYIFDKGQFTKVAFRPVKNYWVGKNYVAYVAHNGRFMLYYNGKAHEITTAPVVVRATDNFLVYFIDEQTWLFDGKKIKLLDAWIKTAKNYKNEVIYPSFALGDSIVAFTNSFDRLLIYANDSLQEVEQWQTVGLMAKENIACYLDVNEILKVYSQNTVHSVELIGIQSYKPQHNLVAYVDNFGSFKVWQKHQVTELRSTKPAQYFVAEDMVAYIDDYDQFVIFYQDKVYDILPYFPKEIIAKDNIIYYIDNNEHAYIFYKGKNIKLASYTPTDVFVEDDFVVYKDLDGHLQGILNGKPIQVSQDIAYGDFFVYNQTVVYQSNSFTWKVFSQGKTYTYLP